ncbi:sigma-E processing peptidase SpoIIGA [Sporolactobacillus laevolacticus]|uniref:Sporulation sigma-E factor-processing peptidase n=1 Tax=Sporolactobacillus laevolacticus DSM 442 TaxID=1395513 RepID=V6IZW1_9BACL|nr:sigma-E processing peptidase SpoIIGA [Sporolactobacillus laevolacticus]EST13138.1 peptidase [Sporolactobacillus laevolacticus DSM 442]
MVVYLDAVWVLNLLIDACLLKLTALMLKRQTSWIHLWSGALIASAVVLILFTPAAFLVDHPIGKLIYSVIIIFVTFGFHRITVFLQNLAAFYFTAFAIGGGLFAVHYFFQDGSFYASNRFLNTMNYGDPISWMTVIIGFPMLWFFSKKRLDQTVTRKWQSSTIADVIVRFSDITIEAKAMIDSGNKLSDPLTQAPVMFLSKEVCQENVPEVFFQAEKAPAGSLDLENLTGDWKNRVAWVPYRAVDGTSRMTLAVRPDQVLIKYEGKRIECTKSLVAFVDHSLSSSGDFSSILHPDMLLHGKMIETAS